MTVTYKVLAVGSKKKPIRAGSAVTILPTRVTAARVKADSGTAQWIAFKAYLDASLDTVIAGAFQGGRLPYLADYALGYQCLKASDPTTAAKYGNKAVALLLSAMTDNIRSASQAHQFLARGNGSLQDYTLAQTPITSTFAVYKRAVNTTAVVRHTANVADDTGVADVYMHKASNTLDGPVDYVRGVDWTQSGNYPDTGATWLGTGTHPADGATYYVSWFDVSSVSPLSSGYTQIGTALHFTAAPAANEGIFVDYLYSAGGNNYQQTGNGYGGYNNIFEDSAFTARYLFYCVCAYDWCYDLLDSSTRALAEQLFGYWVSFVKNGAYSIAQPSWNSQSPYKPGGYDGLASNYASGFYAFRCAAGVALSGHNVSGGSTILSDAVTYRSNYANRDLQTVPPSSQPGGFTGTYLGGWWSEGWGYGPQSIINNLRGGDILYQDGQIANLTDEQTWAAQVVRAVVHSQATTLWFYPGGDLNVYPADIPTRDMMKVAGALSLDVNAQGYAVSYQSVSTGVATADAFGMLYYNPTAASVDWTTTEPSYYYAQGNGLVLSRKDWTYSTMWATMELGNFALAGHNTFSTGTVWINRGTDDLLINATQAAGVQSNVSKNINGNFVLIGTTQVNPGNSGHNTLILAFEGTTAYTYAEGDYKNAYYTGGSTPATELTRVFLHVRASDYLFVYDRVTTTSSATVKQLQWYFRSTSTLSRSTDAWTDAKGSSKLFGKTYSTTGITSADDTVTINSVVTPRITVNPTIATTTLRYATAMQVAASGVGAMDSSALITSSTGKLEGIVIGTVVALFGKIATGAGATGYQVTPAGEGYTFTAASGTTTHYVCDLAPSTLYTLTGADQGSATNSANGVLTLTTTGSGSKTVTIT